MTRLWLGLTLIASLGGSFVTTQQPNLRTETCRVVRGSYSITLERSRDLSTINVRVLQVAGAAAPKKSSRASNPPVPVNVQIFASGSGQADQSSALGLAPASLAVIGRSNNGLAATFDASALPHEFDVVVMSSAGMPQQNCHFDTGAVARLLGKASATPSAKTPPPADAVLVDHRAGARRILIDASRGNGGPWWASSPPVEVFDLSAPHWGKALAEYLRRQNNDVDEVLPGAAITPGMLAGHVIVVRASAGMYSTEELAAYHDYVFDGGRLLLLSWTPPPEQQDVLAGSFGIRLGGLARAASTREFPPPTPTIDRFTRHPVTGGLGKIQRFVGAGILEAPSDFTVLGSLSKDSYLDLNYNSQQDANERGSVPVWGVLRAGRGTVLLFGDLAGLYQTPQPLTRNIFNFLSSR